MAKEIKTGIALSLKDGFSPAIRKAGEEAKGFAGKTLGAINSVDKAFSGMGTKLAAFGLSFSLGAATKDIIELDHRMARVGLTAGAGAEQIAALKREVFKAAKAPDIKIDPSEIVSALDVIMTKTGDLKFAESNVRNVALAMQAAGEAGGPMGDVFAEFAKNGYSAGEISKLMDDMIAQSDQGEFTFAEFAKNAKGVLSAYSAIGNSPDDVKRANAAMQILTAGTKSAEVATTVLNSAVNELLDPKKRDAVEKLGIKVRDIQTGNLRDFNDIMAGLAEASNDLAKADAINSLFGSETLKAVRAYNSEFGRKLKDLLELGDTAGKMSEKSARMAGTLKSNIQGLKTALYEFADANLAGPLAKITESLNELTAHPERMKRLFTEITAGLGAIAAVKGIAGIARVFEGMKGVKSGTLNITESLNMASAMPVYVTNWGGAGLGVPGIGVSGVPAPGGGTGVGLVDRYGKPVASQPKTGFQPKSAGSRFSPNVKGALKGTGGAALVSAAVSGVGLAVELSDIEKNDEMSAAEKSAARGGAGGQFAGDVAGAAAGAFVGTLIMPGVGTMIGGMLGGWLGGKAGRFIGEKLGVTIDKSGAALDAAKAAYESAARELESAVAAQKTAAEVEAAGRELQAAREALAEAETKQNGYDAAKEAAKKAGNELAAAVASGKKPEETAGLYQALDAANAALKAAEAALKAPENPAKAAKPKGHYEYTGVNGIPAWVEPEILVPAMYAAVVNGAETLTPQEPPKALLTGAVDLNITVDGGRTYVTAKTNTPLFKPNMNNCGNSFYGREVSP
jgi:hypothetical protein